VTDPHHGVAQQRATTSPEPSASSGREQGFRVPSIADLARIAGLEDPVLRNLRITQCYHELSLAARDLLGPAANWCSFACWTSKHAGQVIRVDSFLEQLEGEFGSSREVDAQLDPLVRSWSARGTGNSRAQIRHIVWELLYPRAALERICSDVSEWNLTAFSEIGLAFARFLATFGQASEFKQADIDRFCRFLQEAPGEATLSRAFRSYHLALFESNNKLREERILLANVLLSQYEQSLLQSCVGAAFELRAPTTDELERRFREHSRYGSGAFERIADWLTRRGHKIRMHLDRLRAHTDQVLQTFAHEQFFSAHNGSRSTPLGQPTEHGIPPELIRISLGELDLLLCDLSNSHASGQEGELTTTAESERQDDALSVHMRMHHLAQYLRCHQHDPSLTRPPYSETQVSDLQRGVIPKPPL